MNEETRQLLIDEINYRLEYMGSEECSVKDYATYADAVGKLMDRVNEMDKFALSHQTELEKFEEQKMVNKTNRTFKYAELAIPIASCVVACIHRDKIAKALLRFEETGTLTSSVAKGFFGGLFRK